MYSHQSRNTPVWLVVVSAMLLVFGGYFLWRGLVGYLEASGNITAPATTEALLKQTATVGAQSPVPTIDLFLANGTRTAPRTCQDFRVSVLRARIRECPKDTCNTLLMPAQGTRICVYGPATDAPDWYEINIDPSAPIAQIGYMHNSVLDAINPTKHPTQTPTPLPTVTPIPTATPTPTRTPPPSATPNPAAPATWTLTPTWTPVPPVQSAWGDPSRTA
jgi:hypothetical protein